MQIYGQGDARYESGQARQEFLKYQAYSWAH